MGRSLFLMRKAGTSDTMRRRAYGGDGTPRTTIAGQPIVQDRVLADVVDRVEQVRGQYRAMLGQGQPSTPQPLGQRPSLAEGAEWRVVGQTPGGNTIEEGVIPGDTTGFLNAFGGREGEIIADRLLIRQTGIGGRGRSGTASG